MPSARELLLDPAQIAECSATSSRTRARIALELLHGRHAVGADVRAVALDLATEAGHPDLEELVEVAGEDRQELHPLEQGVAPVPRLVEDAGVELHPGQLAVEDRRLDPPARPRRARPLTRGLGAGRTVAIGPRALGPIRGRGARRRPRPVPAGRAGYHPAASRPGPARVPVSPPGRTAARPSRVDQTCIGTLVVGRRSVRRSGGTAAPGSRLAAAGPVAGAGRLGVQRR